MTSTSDTHPARRSRTSKSALPPKNSPVALIPAQQVQQSPALTTAQGVYITVHGHFYQPPRENPYLDAIERQPSAAPYHELERANSP